MNLSKKRRCELFDAICEPVTDLRLDMQRKQMNIDEIDDALFHLQLEIHARVKKSLGVENYKETKGSRAGLLPSEKL